MDSNILKTVVLSSLEKIFPESCPEEKELTHLSALSGEPISFQVAYKIVSGDIDAATVFARITAELPISLYSVGFVPAFQAADPNLNDKYRSGLFPDKLLEKKVNPKMSVKHYPWMGIHVEEDSLHISAQRDSWRSLWITVNERQKYLKGGTYPIKIEFFSGNNGQRIGEASVDIKIISARLPKQELKCTNWFHCDCLCDAHSVEPFSDRFWEIFADYVDKASLNGMNTLLTPCFTPPLDTPIGEERMTVQLVDVYLSNGKYSFDFSKLEKYISIASKNGIKYFEHSHLFTQWGAKHAPKIMACVDGKYKRIFGWESVAWGKKYTEFLHAYIPALLDFLKSKGLDRKFIFHISDEPSPENRESYTKAKNAIGDLLDGYTVGDALSHYEFYEDGTVSTPIVVTTSIEDFYGRSKHLWAYYTGGQCSDGLSNRKLNCSGERNRMIGIQMYMRDIEGFLHWGYNFWYDALSQGFIDPGTDSCFYCGANPATAYLVYPSLNGKCIQSIRQKVFYEGICDMRALKALEKLIGKKETRGFVEDFFGNVTFFTHPGSAENLLLFRELLNQKIESSLNNK
ncbi:MAG: DUF4091 domain-containing protein [Clostridia bacterium]|nr:DUF4091 domain-containing protein [Clostridia bacterium]